MNLEWAKTLLEVSIQTHRHNQCYGAALSFTAQSLNLLSSEPD